jgi:hypothetical protein
MVVDKKKVIKKVVKKATKKVVKKTSPRKSIKKSDLVKNNVSVELEKPKDQADAVLEEFMKAVKSSAEDRYKNRFTRDNKELHSLVKLKPEFEQLDDTSGMWEEMEVKLKSLEEDNLKHFNYREGLRTLAKDMFALSDQEIAYIHSYVKIFKAKKEFEKLRTQVGDDKI